MDNVTIVVEDGNVEQALRRLAKCLKGGLAQEMKRHDHYVSPGERRRVKSRSARKKAAKRARQRARFSNAERPDKPWFARFPEHMSRNVRNQPRGTS